MTGDETDTEWPSWEAWVASRPPGVRALIERFPRGTIIKDGDKTYHLLGYTESDMLIMSELDPLVDYDRARATQVYICAAHLVPEQ